jgi:Peptidase inhibitor family I36
MARKLLLLCGTAVASAIALLGAVGTASAGTAGNAGAPVSTAAHDSGVEPAAMSDCPATDFCVWVNSGYNNGPAKFGGPNPDWRIFSHSSCQTGNWSDCASSGYNHGTSGLGVEVWQNINYGGASACLPRGWHLDNFAGFVYPGTSVSFNDSISSNFWTSNC